MIVIICGPPGSGKTTLATRLHERLAETGRDITLLQSDRFSHRTYERLYEHVRNESSTDWLLDGTFYKREWRERFRSIGTVQLVHLTAALETCLERNRQREDAISEQGVYVIYREFDTPDADIVVDTDTLTPAEAVERVYETLNEWWSTP